MNDRSRLQQVQLLKHLAIFKNTKKQLTNIEKKKKKNRVEILFYNYLLIHTKSYIYTGQKLKTETVLAAAGGVVGVQLHRITFLNYGCQFK